MSENVKWMRRLGRVLNDMPSGHRLLVRHGYLYLVTEEEHKAAFDRQGDFDDCKAEETLFVERVEPHGECI